MRVQTWLPGTRQQPGPASDAEPPAPRWATCRSEPEPPGEAAQEEPLQRCCLLHLMLVMAGGKATVELTWEQCRVPASLGNTDFKGQVDTNQLRLEGQMTFGGEARSSKQAQGSALGDHGSAMVSPLGIHGTTANSKGCSFSSKSQKTNEQKTPCSHHAHRRSPLASPGSCQDTGAGFAVVPGVEHPEDSSSAPEPGTNQELPVLWWSLGTYQPGERSTGRVPTEMV